MIFWRIAPLISQQACETTLDGHRSEHAYTHKPMLKIGRDGGQLSEFFPIDKTALWWRWTRLCCRNWPGHTRFGGSLRDSARELGDILRIHSDPLRGLSDPFPSCGEPRPHVPLSVGFLAIIRRGCIITFTLFFFNKTQEVCSTPDWNARPTWVLINNSIPTTL